MEIRFAHLREPGAHGGYVDYAVFDAKPTLMTPAALSAALARLTAAARAAGRKVDQAALAYWQNGRQTFYGSPPLVDHLSKVGVHHWTHTMSV